MLSVRVPGLGARVTKEIARLGAAARSRNLKRYRHPEAGAAEFGQRGGKDRALARVAVLSR